MRSCSIDKTPFAVVTNEVLLGLNFGQQMALFFNDPEWMQ